MRWLKLWNRSEPDESPKASAIDKPDYVVERGRIVRLLEDLSTNNVLLHIRLPGLHHPFVSSLLEVDATTGHLYFDELMPAQGHELIAQRDSFKVEALLRGITLSFVVSDFAVSEQRGIALYRASIPEEIHYPQRRRDFRLTISSTLAVPFSGELARLDLQLRGNLTNLSNGGMAFITRVAVPPKPGDRLRKCRLSLPEQDSIPFELGVHYVQRNARDSRTIIGGSFINLDKVGQRLVREFLQATQREQRREEADTER